MRLLVALAVVAAVFYVLTFHHTSSTGDTFDKILIAMLTLAFTWAALVVLLSRKFHEWTNEGVSIFLNSLGLGILFGGVFYVYWKLMPGYMPAPMTAGQSTPPRTPEWVVDLGRALLVVGGPLKAWSLTHYSIDNPHMFRLYGRGTRSPTEEHTERIAVAAEVEAEATVRLAEAAEASNKGTINIGEEGLVTLLSEAIGRTKATQEMADATGRLADQGDRREVRDQDQRE